MMGDINKIRELESQIESLKAEIEELKKLLDKAIKFGDEFQNQRNILSQESKQAIEIVKRLNDKDLINYSIGKVMSETRGKINPDHVKLSIQIYQSILKGDKNDKTD